MFQLGVKNRTVKIVLCIFASNTSLYAILSSNIPKFKLLDLKKILFGIVVQHKFHVSVSEVSELAMHFG